MLERRLYKVVEWVTLQETMRLWVGVGVLQDPREPHRPHKLPKGWLKLMKWVKRRGRWRLAGGGLGDDTETSAKMAGLRVKKGYASIHRR